MKIYSGIIIVLVLFAVSAAGGFILKESLESEVSNVNIIMRIFKNEHQKTTLRARVVKTVPIIENAQSVAQLFLHSWSN